MKGDLFIRIIVSGILLCLIVIASKLNTKETIPASVPNVEVSDRGGRVVQIAPNRVGVVDFGIGSGWEQLVVFEYNPKTQKFEVVSTLPYEDVFNHPEENGIPERPY